MRKIFAAAFLFIFLFNICKAQDPKINEGVSTFVVDSKILKEQKTSYIYFPSGYQNSDTKYPVVYLLDAEYYFTFTTEAVKILYDNERIPPCIVVGITTSNRSRDFTPASDKGWDVPSELSASGGADNFLSYIETELAPYVEKNYRTQPFRIIAGHSLGGLFAMYSFVSKPDLFQGYIALESSLWWSNGSVGNSVIDQLSKNPERKAKLFMGRLQMPREVWFPVNEKMVDFFEKNHPAGLEYKYMEFDDETHSTMVFPGVYFGLKSIFSDYFFVLDEKANETSIMSYYSDLSKKYGYEVTLPQQIYIFLWFQSMEAKKYNDAVKYGELRIKYYPDSFRAYKNLAQTYSDMGNKEKAAELLEKAKKLNPGG